jgi:hypothetical protein
MTRAVTIVLLALAAVDCSRPHVKPGRRVIVLGVDGLDYQLVGRLIAEGRMPNFARISASGAFQPLASSIPPQSPVAWSSFITGLDPGRTGIFDFIHRDEHDGAVLSTSGSRTTVGAQAWPLADCPRRPRGAAAAVAFRSGQHFENRAVRTTIIRMPANFPLGSRHARAERHGNA